MKITLIVDTRPQIIKSQPIIKELLSHKAKVSIIHTGQHYDYEMSKSFFNKKGTPPPTHKKCACLTALRKYDLLEKRKGNFIFLSYFDFLHCKLKVLFTYTKNIGCWRNSIEFCNIKFC